MKQPIKGLPFTVKIQSIFNIGGGNYSGKINIGHYAADGTLYGPIAQDVVLTDLEPTRGVSDVMTCKVTREMMPGDYIAAIYWNNQKKRWEMARSYYDGTTQKIVIFELDKPALIKGTSLKYDRTTKRLSVKTFADLKVTLMQGTTKALEVDATGEWQDISAPAGSYKLVVGDPKSGVSCSINVKL